MKRTQNKITINSGSSQSFENDYYNQDDNRTRDFGILDTARVLEYNEFRREGTVMRGTQHVVFKNASGQNILINDTVLIANANGVDYLVCIGVYPTEDNYDA